MKTKNMCQIAFISYCKCVSNGKKKRALVKHFRSTYTIFSIKININFMILYRYGGWSFGLPLTNDLRFDVTSVPANRTLAKVNYELSSGMSCNWECKLEMFKHFYEVKTKHGYNQFEEQFGIIHTWGKCVHISMSIHIQKCP